MWSYDCLLAFCIAEYSIRTGCDMAGAKTSLCEKVNIDIIISLQSPDADKSDGIRIAGPGLQNNCPSILKLRNYLCLVHKPALFFQCS